MAAGTKRGRKAQATRSVLMEAALEVMSRKGYAAATIDEIAKEAGVSKGLAYYHFDSKETLASEILEVGINALVDASDLAVTHVQEDVNALEVMLVALCGGIAQDYRFARFYLSAHWCEDGVDSPGLQQAEDRLMGSIANLLEEGKTQGSVNEDIDAQFAAASIVGLVLAGAARHLVKGCSEEDRTSFVRGIVPFALGIVGSVPSAVLSDVKQLVTSAVLDEAEEPAASIAPEEEEGASPSVILGETKDLVESEPEPEPEVESAAAEESESPVAPEPMAVELEPAELSAPAVETVPSTSDLGEAEDLVEPEPEPQPEPEPAKPKKAKKSKPAPEDMGQESLFSLL